MVRRALALLVTTASALAGPVGIAHAGVQDKPSGKPLGELRVCGEGAVMDVFIDRGELHEEKRGLAAGKCKNFAVPKGKWAVTLLGFCENNRDSKLADIAVAPESRALYQDQYLAGARVVRESTTTYTATWTCLGVTESEPDPGTSPPPFG